MIRRCMSAARSKADIPIILREYTHISLRLCGLLAPWLLRRFDAKIAQDTEHHIAVALENATRRFKIGRGRQYKVVQHLLDLGVGSA